MDQNIDSSKLESLKEQLDQLRDLRTAQAAYKIDRFNIFDVLRVTWLELPHSNFLAFLLNPKQNHSWGAAFLELFLRQVHGSSATGTEFAEYIKGMDFSQMEVLREWEHIDILLRDEANHIIIIIENKITSGEGEGQLKSYWDKVQAKYDDPSWTKKAIFLTPRGIAASHSEYQAMGYHTIAQILADSSAGPLAHLPSELNPDDKANIESAVQQYVQMLRRHIVEDRNITELSKQILQEHFDQLQYLQTYYQSWLKDMVRQLSKRLDALVRQNNQSFFVDQAIPSYLRFGVASLENVSELNAKNLNIAEGLYWTPSGQMLLFVWSNLPGYLGLSLDLYCTRDEIRNSAISLREKVEGMANVTPIFHVEKSYPSWIRIYERPILREADYQPCDEAALFARLDTEWESFLAGDFVLITQALEELFLNKEP